MEQDWTKFGLPSPPVSADNGRRWDREVAWLTLDKLQGVEERVKDIQERGCAKHCGIEDKIAALEAGHTAQGTEISGVMKAWQQVQGGVKIAAWCGALVYFGIQAVTGILDIIR